MKTLLKLFCYCVFMSVFVQNLYANKTFTMAFAHEPSSDPQYKFYERIYTEAFKELGYDFKYKIFPSKRSSIMANLGEVDGEPQRIFTYAKRQPNLVRVEEPIFVNRTLALTTNLSMKIEGLEYLEGMDYRVDYLRGSVWSKRKLSPLVLADRLTPVENNEQGFKRLLYDRTDIFITLEVWALKTLALREFENSDIRVAGVIGSNFSYPYLHKSHSKIAAKLAKVLKQMKEDGRYQKIYELSMPFMQIK